MGGGGKLRPAELYRAILRQHKKLPPRHRALGDRYVRSEFQAHKSAKPEQVAAFLQQWREYLSTLQHQPTQFGRPLGTEDIQALSDDQKSQLLRMRSEAEKHARKTEP